MTGGCAYLACEVAVRRALEVAGKRMLTRSNRGRTCLNTPSYLVYTCLVPVADQAQLARVLCDAWSCLPEEMEWFIPTLDEYVRLLLTTGLRHNPDDLRDRIPAVEVL